MTQTFLLVFALFAVAVMAISLYWNNSLVKFASIAFFVVLANCVYFALDGVKGWPAEEPNEVKGTLASVVIVNPSSTDKGGIYISIFLTEKPESYKYLYPRIAPKTFYVEYSNNRAAQFEKAKQAMAEGKEVRINGIPPKESSGEGQDGTDDLSEIGTLMNGIMNKLLSNQKDTYKPKTPGDLEIVEQRAPPPKGKQP
jgi:hypothetical protein